MTGQQGIFRAGRHALTLVTLLALAAWAGTLTNAVAITWTLQDQEPAAGGAYRGWLFAAVIGDGAAWLGWAETAVEQPLGWGVIPVQDMDLPGAHTLFPASVRPTLRADLALGVVLLIAMSAAVWMGKGRGRSATNCGHCGYDLTGNVSGRCPECGLPAQRGLPAAGMRPAFEPVAGLGGPRALPATQPHRPGEPPPVTSTAIERAMQKRRRDHADAPL